MFQAVLEGDKKLAATLKNFSAREVKKITHASIRKAVSESRKLTKRGAPEAFKKFIGGRTAKLSNAKRAEAKVGINVGFRPVSLKARDAVGFENRGKRTQGKIKRAQKRGYAKPHLHLLVLGTGMRSTRRGASRGRISPNRWLAPLFQSNKQRVIEAARQGALKQLEKSIRDARSGT